MPTVVKGVRGTGTSDTETRQVRDVLPMMQQLEPDESPLLQILSHIGKRGTKNPKIEWFEDELNPRFDKLNASLSSGAATMTVTNFAYFRKGDLVKVNNAEGVRVPTTPTAAAGSIDRSVGSTCPVPASNQDALHLLGNAHESVTP